MFLEDVYMAPSKRSGEGFSDPWEPAVVPGPPHTCPRFSGGNAGMGTGGPGSPAESATLLAGRLGQFL